MIRNREKQVLTYETSKRNGKWYKGDENPLGRNVVGSNGYVMVIASGAELTYILERFCNLPFVSDTNQQSWTGDFASFILNNLTDRV